MSRFKIGDKVRIVSGPYGSHEIGDIGEVTATTCGAGYHLEVTVDGSEGCYKRDELELITEDTDMKYKQGDVLVNERSGYLKVVQGMIGDIVFSIDGDDSAVRTQSITKLEGMGWHLKTEEKTTELTIDEIAKKFDLKPEQVRIKKEDK